MLVTDSYSLCRTVNMSDETKDELLTENSVIKLLGLNRITLNRLRAKGRIGFYRIGRTIRYSPEHVQEFLEQHERPARKPRPIRAVSR